jgi:hypothetical protein
MQLAEPWYCRRCPRGRPCRSPHPPGSTDQLHTGWRWRTRTPRGRRTPRCNCRCRQRTTEPWCCRRCPRGRGCTPTRPPGSTALRHTGTPWTTKTPQDTRSPGCRRRCRPQTTVQTQHHRSQGGRGCRHPPPSESTSRRRTRTGWATWTRWGTRTPRCSSHCRPRWSGPWRPRRCPRGKTLCTLPSTVRTWTRRCPRGRPCRRLHPPGSTGPRDTPLPWATWTPRGRRTPRCTAHYTWA